VANCTGHFDDALQLLFLHQFQLGLFLFTDIHEAFNHTRTVFDSRLGDSLVDGYPGAVTFEQDMLRPHTGTLRVCVGRCGRFSRIDESGTLFAKHVPGRQSDHLCRHGVYFHDGLVDGVNHYDTAGHGFNDCLDPLAKESVLHCQGSLFKGPENGTFQIYAVFYRLGNKIPGAQPQSPDHIFNPIRGGYDNNRCFRRLRLYGGEDLEPVYFRHKKINQDQIRGVLPV